jgi:hypothetical protein
VSLYILRGVFMLSKIDSGGLLGIEGYIVESRN